MMKTLIVGTGFGGLCLAARLREQGDDDFIILEKAKGVGGTWRENTYPGAECDIPSALYSYSFAPNPTWDFKWAKQPQILKYIQKFASDRDLIRHIHFGQSVISAIYDKGRWTVKTAQGETYEAQFFVSAIGQLHVPSFPNFKGRESFKGDSFHSAQWDHAVELKGKKIGVLFPKWPKPRNTLRFINGLRIGLSIKVIVLIRELKNGYPNISLPWPDYIVRASGCRANM